MFATRVSIRWTRVLCGSPGQRGLPALELVERAQTAAVKLRLREQTETAKCKGILGAPTFLLTSQDVVYEGWPGSARSGAVGEAKR